jgi:hypothetical protein
MLTSPVRTARARTEATRTGRLALSLSAVGNCGAKRCGVVRTGGRRADEGETEPNKPLSLLWLHILPAHLEALGFVESLRFGAELIQVLLQGERVADHSIILKALTGDGLVCHTQLLPRLVQYLDPLQRMEHRLEVERACEKIGEGFTLALGVSELPWGEG